MLSFIVAALNLIGIILIVAIALGLVIFVHELGHFIVAKLCRVKVEKFYLGFDIGGWRLWKFTRGETQYGIGVLPLGGYVKMLGQEDNPARLRAEIERAKLQQTMESTESEVDFGHSQRSEGSPDALPKDETTSPPGKDFDLAAAEQALYNPRSYLAKSVPQRMAIISAGVIMNVIFAFFTAIAAYYLGVEQLVCAVGNVVPGEAAWRAGIRPGDRIEEITGHKTERYQDLLKYIAVGDIENGITLMVKRTGVTDLIKFSLHPDLIHGRPTIGVTIPHVPVLFKEMPQNIPPVIPGSAASRAKPPLRPGDRIVAVDGAPINNYAQLIAQLAEHLGETLQLTVQCTQAVDDQKPAGPETSILVNVAVPPQPVRTLGMVMTMGEITAIQQDSPAAAAGVKNHDRLLKIDGKPVDDPMMLPDQLRRRTGEKISVTLQRQGLADPIDVQVTLRRADWYDQPLRANNPVSIPELGVAYQVLNRVDRIVPGSPAEKAGIQPGLMLVQATILPPDNGDNKNKIEQSEVSVDFDDQNLNWPFFFAVLQGEDIYMVHPASKVKLAFGDDQMAMLKPEIAPHWFNPNRGFILDYDTIFVKAQTLGRAIALGADETWGSLTLVVRILRKIGSQISVKELSGPISIAAMAGKAAQQGPSTLLLFLTLLSANLAVLNLLPIPILDGGHLLFLAYEGIRGKPADERIQIGLSILGLFFLVSLMLYVTGMDIVRLFFRGH